MSVFRSEDGNICDMIPVLSAINSSSDTMRPYVHQSDPSSMDSGVCGAIHVLGTAAKFTDMHFFQCHKSPGFTLCVIVDASSVDDGGL